ncbi:MAG TPA: DMT family transporter [Burkholderiaceae bacterium]|nr:DMT family transporter [Burkholderiaceae bacterium]
MHVTRRQWLLLAAITLMWGFNWPMMKFSLREVPPLTFRALTMTGGVLLMAAWCSLRGTSLALPRAQVGRVLALSLPNIVGWHFASIIGLTQLAAGRAVILAFTMPVWTVLLGALLFGQHLTRRAGVASLCALVAVALLAIDEFTALAGRPIGVLWLQVAAVSWALGTLLMRRIQMPLSTEALTVWMMVVGALLFWAAALVAEPLPNWHAWSRATWVSLIWGIVINFGVSQVLWFGLARELPAQAAAFSMMGVPLVGVLSSALVVGEVPSASDWLAVLFIAAAIAAATGVGARAAAGGDNARR